MVSTVDTSRVSLPSGASTGTWIWNGLLIAALLALPLVAPRYWIYFAGLLGINIIATHGLNIMMGYTGLLSLGHAAFVGVGAYTVAILQTYFGLPFWITVPMAGVSAAVIGVAFGLPSLRIRGLYLVIATLAAQFILTFVFVHWQSVTNGDVGLPVRPATVFGYPLNNETRIYYLILAAVVFLTIFARNVIKSRVGRAFIAIRERDLTAQVLGVEIVTYKLIAFALGSFYAGVAGGLLAYFNQFVNPEQFGLLLSVFFLSAVIVGGMGSILGAILGAAFMTLLPEILRESSLLFGEILKVDLGTVLTPLRETIFGLLMVAFLILEPRGLAQLWKRARQKFSSGKSG
ncbi:branched-chain amino acid ABC transporter permease [Mesorhizobium australicum]|uniref:Amino acid/amide ABC transporter membrane protein 2, HAAT family n=1 Tax=Mesorhizobium australicum TaxID=536018 RepID=A0A1X7N139_9HYPH|nr:branched-chain amino acid ABC transporter permease [Mesorhizobium australicum]SMH30963.1 amino acid/amide ABC transporter membrane protein 2, HAAT family [Mesorhizobium australicum]